MKRHSPFTGSDESFGLQMTSMIDVIFLLLIFFICTSTFQLPENLLSTKLTAMSGSQTSVNPVIPEEILDLGEIVIIFHWDGRCYWEINSTRYDTLDAVNAVLRAVAMQSVEMPVILDVAPNIPLEDTLDVYNSAIQLGFSRVQFAVNQDPT